MSDKPSGLHVLILAPGRNPVDVLERAIARLSEEQRIPHEIHVVASHQRLLELQRESLAGRDGALARACAAAGFARDEILFNQRTLHSLQDHTGASDCGSEADRVLQLLRQLSSADDSSLTVIAAEDAGAAGHLLHGAMQIAGRVSDRFLLDLSRAATRRRRSTEGTPQPHCRHVQVPILLWPANEPVPHTYAEAVRRRRVERLRVTRPDVLRLDSRRRTVSVGETSVTLPAMQFFWLWYLASVPGERFPLPELTSLAGGRRQAATLTQTLSDGRVRVFPSDLQRAFAQLFPAGGDKFEAMYQRACGQHPGLPSTISKINAALRRALGRGSGPYLIQGGRGAGGYRVKLPASAIQTVGVEAKRA